jgi:hypothetical protein
MRLAIKNEKKFWQIDFVGKVLNPLIEDINELDRISRVLPNTGLRLLCEVNREEAINCIVQLKSTLVPNDKEIREFDVQYWGTDLGIIASYKKMKCWGFTGCDEASEYNEMKIPMPASKSKELSKGERVAWVRLSYTTTTADCISEDLNPLALYGEEHKALKSAVLKTIDKAPSIVWTSEPSPHYYRLTPELRLNDAVKYIDTCIASLAKKITMKCIEHFEEREEEDES